MARTNANKFHIETGTVRCYIARDKPFYMRHFGRAEYDSKKPVMSDSLRDKGTKICDALNNKTMTIAEAEKALDAIYF